MSSRLHIEQIETEEALLQISQTGDIAVVEGFANARRRCEALAWRAIVRREIGANVVISYDEYGAPRVDVPSTFISVSHSRGVVAVLISEHQCAVDIEDAERDFAKVAERYLSPAEYRVAEQYDLFAEMWCAKEALYKYHKKGGVDLVKDLVISDYMPKSNTLVATILGGEPIEITLRREGTLVVAQIG